MAKYRLAKILAILVRGQSYFIVAVLFSFVFIEEKSVFWTIKILNFKIDLKSSFIFIAYMFCKFGQGDEIICLHTFQIIPLRIVDIL